jgi:hypothetical protein
VVLLSTAALARRQVREAATVKKQNSDLVDLKLDLERATSARQTSPAATKLAGLAEAPEEASDTMPQQLKRENGGFQPSDGEPSRLSRISERARDSTVRLNSHPLHPLRRIDPHGGVSDTRFLHVRAHHTDATCVVCGHVKRQNAHRKKLGSTLPSFPTALTARRC